MSKRMRSTADNLKIATGYPVPAQEFSLLRIADYFAGSAVRCLLCGGQYKALGAHLTRTHGMAPDDYKERYGLPYSRGLCSSDTLKLRGDKAREEAMTAGGKARLERNRAVCAETVRRKIECGTYAARTSASKSQHSRARAMRGHDLDEIIRTMREDMILLSEARVKLGRFCEGTVLRFVNESGRSAEVCEAHEALPFHVQARGEALGERFRVTISGMAGEGLSIYEIGERLNVSFGTVAAHLRAIRRGGGMVTAGRKR